MDEQGDQVGPSSGRPQRLSAQQAREYYQTLPSDDLGLDESEEEFSDEDNDNESSSNDEGRSSDSESDNESADQQPRPPRVVPRFTNWTEVSQEV